MNHSCNPSVSLDTDTLTVVAVHDLKEGNTEVFRFYLPAVDDLSLLYLLTTDLRFFFFYLQEIT